MAQQTITGGNGVSGQTGEQIKDIINENFTELYGSLYVYRSGRFHSNNITAGSTTTQALAANTLRAWPFIVERPLTITEIVSEVTTFAGGTSYRIGLYTDNGAYPGSLVSGTDVGTYDSTANAVRSSGAISVSIVPGLYWIAFNSNGTPTMRAHASSTIMSLGTASTLGANSFLTAVTVAEAYAAMPSTFTGGGTFTLLSCPIAAFKI